MYVNLDDNDFCIAIVLKEDGSIGIFDTIKTKIDMLEHMEETERELPTKYSSFLLININDGFNDALWERGKFIEKVKTTVTRKAVCNG